MDEKLTVTQRRLFDNLVKGTKVLLPLGICFMVAGGLIYMALPSRSMPLLYKSLAYGLVLSIISLMNGLAIRKNLVSDPEKAISFTCLLGLIIIVLGLGFWGFHSEFSEPETLTSPLLMSTALIIVGAALFGSWLGIQITFRSIGHSQRIRNG